MRRGGDIGTDRLRQVKLILLVLHWTIRGGVLRIAGVRGVIKVNFIGAVG